VGRRGAQASDASDGGGDEAGGVDDADECGEQHGGEQAGMAHGCERMMERPCPDRRPASTSGASWPVNGELEPSGNPIFRALRKDLEKAYRSLGVQPIFVEVARASELEDAVANVARQRAQVMHVPNDDLFLDNRVAIMRVALRYALPTIVDRYAILEAGGLLYYNFSEAELQRRGAAFIDKILRGAKPGDLPVEQVTQFELGINLKTANALGITVPQSLLLRADPDRVIR